MILLIYAIANSKHDRGEMVVSLVMVGMGISLFCRWYRKYLWQV